jgi:hypothetical protein
MDRIMGTLEAFKRTVWALRHDGLDVDAIAVHPITVNQLVRHVIEWGADPFPGKRFSWRHPFRRRDPRPYLIGIPVEVTPQIEIGVIGMSGNDEVKQKFDKYFSEYMGGGGSTPVPDGVLSDLDRSAGRETFTDLMIKAMEGLDRVQHVIVLRFTDTGMDSFSDFNQLELQAALQRAAMRVMQDNQ